MAKPPTRFRALLSSFFFTRARFTRKALRFSDPLKVSFIARLNKSATMSSASPISSSYLERFASRVVRCNSLVFLTLVGGKLLVASEILPGPIDVSHGFIEQPQFPFSKSEFRRQFPGLVEVCQPTIVLALRQRAVGRCIQPANVHSILARQSQQPFQVSDASAHFTGIEGTGRHFQILFQQSDSLSRSSIGLSTIRQIEGRGRTRG